MRPARPLILALAAALGVAACTNTAERYEKATVALEFQGKLRTETAPADAPFTNADLARNFVEVAMNSEYNAANEEVVTPKPLRRWETPLGYTIIGDGVTATDRQSITDLMRRIEDLTDLRFEETDKKFDILIGILDAGERRTFSQQMTERLGEDLTSFQNRWVRDDRYPCIGQFFLKPGGAGGIALVLIKNELSGVYRKACIHEEIVQSLGLTNDGDDIRPSIFNDDQEFALLTRHDEYLLRILYDDRLSFGMTEDEVRPLLPEIIADIRPEGEGAL